MVLIECVGYSVPASHFTRQRKDESLHTHSYTSTIIYIRHSEAFDLLRTLYCTSIFRAIYCIEMYIAQINGSIVAFGMYAELCRARRGAIC